MLRLPRSLLCVLALLAAASSSACAEPPTREINQAQGAIEAARAAGADVYAPDDLAAAVTALERAHAAVEQRDYRQALSQALESKERARDAARSGAERMAQLRSQAEQVLESAAQALQTAAARVTGPETPRAGTPAYELRVALDAVKASLQEARAAFDRQEYQAAIDRASAARKQITDALTTLVDAGRARRPAARR